MGLRIGIGYDVHKLVIGRKLVIGGELISFEKGLLGHSDADVLTHAIMDALLGAACKGDIGRHFPDTDKKFKDADSMKLLLEVKKMLDEENYKIINIDSVIIAQEPKLNPYIESMIDNISETLITEPSSVNIKATTEEWLGFTGSGEGIAAKAVCLLEKI